MQQLLNKIRQSSAANKCALAAEAHAELEQALENLQPLVDSTPAKDLNLEVFDKAIDEFEAVLEALECLLVGLTAPEAKRIREALEKEYAESVEMMKFYELLGADGRSYIADYAEFTDRRFMLPTKVEILERLTPQKLKLYQKMEQQGLEPKLQITPIAFRIRTLGKKLDAKKAGQMNTGNTYVWEDIKDGELQYAPTSVKASSDGKQIQISGGMSKSQWIKANGGFLVDIVPMKPELDADPEIQKNKKGVVNYNAVQAEGYAAKLKEAGLSPMGYETYLLAQMQAIKAGKPLEVANWSLLLDSNLKDSRYLADGLWRDVGVGLLGGFGGGRNGSLRSRGSVRV